jgi:hypothetical protein
MKYRDIEYAVVQGIGLKQAPPLFNEAERNSVAVTNRAPTSSPRAAGLAG